VITIEMVMLVALGFLTAALLAIFVSPLYRRRVARLTTDALKRSMPLTEAEIRADKDRLRAEYAMQIHRLQMKVDEAAESSARQMIEINRRDASITDLEEELSRQSGALEEHENARRVLEQTIMDRLPKVEHRLAEARKLLFQRDREIVTLSQASEKQNRALEEAGQINTQQTDEIHRLKAALNTRAARNREGLGDPRFESEVALRTEIEALRSKTRDQAALIARLQALLVRAGPASEASGAESQSLNGTHDPIRPAKVVGGRRGASAAANEQPPLQAIETRQDAEAVAKVQADLRKFKATNEDQAAEISRLKAALATYENADKDERGVKESKIALKARLSAIKALSDQQGTTIQTLRAEVAASNERLARQAAYFMEEMRRLGSGTVPASVPAQQGISGDQSKRPLVERINDPRVTRLVRTGTPRDDKKSNPRRVTGFLKALDGDAPSQPQSEAQAASAEAGKADAGQGAAADSKSNRRPRLLDRITGLDKNSA